MEAKVIAYLDGRTGHYPICCIKNMKILIKCYSLSFVLYIVHDFLVGATSVERRSKALKLCTNLTLIKRCYFCLYVSDFCYNWPYQFCSHFNCEEYVAHQ